MKNPLIYLDNAATTYPKPASVLNEMRDFMLYRGGNPGRGSYSLSFSAAEAVFKCRSQIVNIFRSNSPENVVFTYQGDGDLASIGMCETVHAAARGENITVIFINNAIYGMTGGQMAPTSLPGQVTQTSPYGRNVDTQGYPVRVCEMLSSLDGPAYLERVTVNNVKNVNRAKKAIKKAFQNQLDGKGFSLVEVLSSCPTNWGMTPQKALEWIDEKMIPYYPLGVYKDKEG